ncbi:hypothetical protein [Stigmatella aurantiaca]|uniref:Conserved uncharacterized protein n=1 Tax=Stigmatella aurantiaca (strain DW4/3-1) TaxID=378806 RepID=E3FZN5_STIAD|nr:hypothetical protein [Stigmatella aurantiaca]ADO68700.1 conserved uncharacterized protein [Stigmatella aurantiaca DW4/3-1]
MPAISAHGGTLLVAGAAQSFTRTPAERVGDDPSPAFRVVSEDFNRLDPATAVSVEVDTSGTGTAFADAQAGTYTVNYLFGVVVFDTPPAVGTLVRVSGTFLPVYPVALVRSLSLSISNDVVELLVFGDGYKRREVTLRDFSGELTGLASAADDLAPGLAVVTLASAQASGAAILAEFGRGDGEVFRAWVKLPELSHKLTPGALYEHTIKFVGHSFQAADGEFVAWGYGTP